jgi:hypothetical protein
MANLLVQVASFEVAAIVSSFCGGFTGSGDELASSGG